jgi:hypothetical protein
MAAVYAYVCRKCGAKTELEYGKEGTRHLIPSPKVAKNMVVCGVFRRDWSSINVSTSNLKRARR